MSVWNHWDFIRAQDQWCQHHAWVAQLDRLARLLATFGSGLITSSTVGQRS
ncbi:MAG TPA: hypothetical protein VE465_24360 [Streptosporangiaceae bacterium]|nr:hypothetical protein [Streptosporangiaceae bacterium]